MDVVLTARRGGAAAAPARESRPLTPLVHVLDSVAVWLFLLAGYGIAAGAALRAGREGSSEATV